MIKRPKMFKSFAELKRQIKERRAPGTEDVIYMSREEMQQYFNNLMGSDIPVNRPKYFNGYRIEYWPESTI